MNMDTSVNRPVAIMQYWSFLLVISVNMVALLAGCAGPKQRDPTLHPVVIKQPQINIASLEKQIHRLINEERRKHHLSPLAWDSDLSGIARKHSRDMSRRNYFAHNSPDGHDFSYRYKQAGYQCALRVDSKVYMGAENILQNNLYDSVTTINGQAFYDWNSHERLAETTVQGWMNSPGHRQNILMPLWKNEGIGIFISPDDKVYITQNFC